MEEVKSVHCSSCGSLCSVKSESFDLTGKPEYVVYKCPNKRWWNFHANYMGDPATGEEVLFGYGN